MKFTVNVISNEEFENSIKKGTKDSEIEVRTEGIVYSTRLFLRSIDIFDKKVDKYQDIFNRTKNKRIREKQRNKLNEKLNHYLSIIREGV